MLEYLALLLIISFVFAVVFTLVKNRISLHPKVFYIALGISLALGTVFPMAIASLTTIEVLTIYICVIVLSASILSFAEKRFSINTYPASDNVIDSKSESTPDIPAENTFACILNENIATLEACTTEILPPQTEPPAVQDETEHHVETEIPGHVQDKNLDIKAESGLYSTTTNETEECDSIISTAVDDEIPVGDESSAQDEAVTGEFLFKNYISAGFKAKAKGNLAGAIDYFFKALQLNPGGHTCVELALEISAIYQELGQYHQAGMLLNSVRDLENINTNSVLRHKLQGQLIYLDTLAKFLEKAKIPYAPYKKIPNFIKIKATFESNKRLKELSEEEG